MVLVLSVVGIAAVLAIATLTAASLHTEIATEAPPMVAADALADSGLEAACFYLLNPNLAPGMTSRMSYWPGANPLPFVSSGTVTVSVTPLGGSDYEVLSTGSIVTGGRTIKRSAHARLNVKPGFQSRFGLAFNGADVRIAANATITGDVQAPATLTNYGKVNGQVITQTLNNLGTVTSGTLNILTTGVPASVVPVATNLRDYSTYTWGGATYTAKVITSLPAGTTLGPTPDNPAGVFKFNGSPTLLDNTTINGTLIVDTLNVNGNNSKIMAAPGFPALVARTDIMLKGLLPTQKTTITGLIWVGGSFKSATTARCAVDVHGAMLFGGSGSVDPTLTGKLNLWFEPDKIRDVQLDSSIPPPNLTFYQYSNRKDSL